MPWSPDGSALAFTARTVPAARSSAPTASDVLGDFCSSRIFVAAADGSTGAVQVGDPEMDARTVAWSPDGTTLAFGGGMPGRGSGSMSWAPTARTFDGSTRPPGFGWAFMRLEWSPDGKSIVATAGEEEWDIWVFAADGSTATNVSDDPGEPEVVADELFPSYGPDGAIAWESASGLVLLEPGGTPVEFPG